MSLYVITVVSCVEFGKKEKKNYGVKQYRFILLLLLLFLFLMHNCFGFVYFFFSSFVFFLLLLLCSICLAYYRINILRVCCSRFQKTNKTYVSNIDTIIIIISQYFHYSMLKDIKNVSRNFLSYICRRQIVNNKSTRIKREINKKKENRMTP